MTDTETKPAQPRRRTTGFKITHGKGFHITFENGWTVSVQFGPGNYGDNYDMRIGEGGSDVEAGKRGSRTAEAGVFNPATGTLEPLPNGDTVDGYQSPAQVLALLNTVAAKGAA